MASVLGLGEKNIIAIHGRMWKADEWTDGSGYQQWSRGKKNGWRIRGKDWFC